MSNRNIQNIEAKINKICQPYGVRALIMPGYKGKRPGPEDKDYSEGEYDYYFVQEGKTPPIREGTYGYIVIIETEGSFLGPKKEKTLMTEILSNFKEVGRVLWDYTKKE